MNRYVYRAALLARQILGRAWMRAARLKPNENTVYFSSFVGRAYSDSPRRISEKLHEMRPDIDIVWQLKDPSAAPAYVRTVPPRSLKALTELSRARCIVDNFNRPIYHLKFDSQLYVQTWHGDRGFKKCLYDMEDGLKYPDGAQMDLAVAGSRFGTAFYRSAFRYKGEVMCVGMPRNDILLSGDRADAVREAGLPEDTRFLLYAPTFRDATAAGGDVRAGFDLSKALDTLERSTGDRWMALTRAHAHDACIGGVADERIRDMTAYPEMADLLLSADLLISDYSSSPGDFILLDRPLILYQPDLERFRAESRGFYFEMDEACFTRAKSEAELMDMLSDFNGIRRDQSAVRDFYGVSETGHAAESVAEWISERMPQG